MGIEDAGGDDRQTWERPPRMGPLWAQRLGPLWAQRPYIPGQSRLLQGSSPVAALVHGSGCLRDSGTVAGHARLRLYHVAGGS